MKTFEKTIQLIPVIELEPYDFKKGDYESPLNSSREVPNDWDKYNQKCYQDSGLKNITAIKTGLWHFNIEQFDPNQLRIILKAIYSKNDDEHLKEIFNNPEEFAPYFSGGYVFVANDEVKSIPGCCCGLESIKEWKRIPNEERGEIWMGHDIDAHIYFETEKKYICFEINNESFNLSFEEYSEIIANLEDKLYNLISKSGKVLNDIFNIENGRDVAKGMIYK